MALASYSDLKTSVANWLGRSDLTATIPDFIRLAHTQMMRDMRGHLRLQKRDPSFSISGEYMPAPVDFLEFVSGYLNGTPNRPLTFMANDTQTALYNAGSGIPINFSLGGSQGGNTETFRFAPPPDGGYTATIQYYAKLPFFASDADLNWILTDYPDLYLYGACYQGAVYLKDAAAAQDYMQLYTSSLNNAMDAGRRARWGGNGMAVRVA